MRKLVSQRLFQSMVALSVFALFSVVNFVYDDKWSRVPVWMAVVYLLTFGTGLVGQVWLWWTGRRRTAHKL
jgi:protein-S-isoprenylcysteine O-methyltransferase Ste14